MPLFQTTLRIFVSSPVDCTQERTVLDDVVDEINNTWSAPSRIRLEVLKWETHTFPAAGSSPQGTINAQIGDTYDIFIGIMWGRFGTPTSDYDSGTEEEARRALHRNQANPDSVKIMFYFKDAPLPPSRIDTAQLKKVQAFKSELGTEGIYYWTFTDTQQFSGFVRLHLSRVIQTYWIDTSAVSPSDVVDGERSASQIEDEQEELGLLDFLELAQGNIDAFTACLERIISAMEDSTANNKERTAELDALNSTGKAADNSAVKKISKLLVEDWLTFVRRIEAEIPIFAESYNNALKYATGAANISVADFHPVDPGMREKQLRELHGLRQAIGKAGPNLSLLTESLEKAGQAAVRFPRVNVALNKAKRRIADALSRLVEKQLFAQKANQEAIQLLDQLIQQLEAKSI